MCPPILWFLSGCSSFLWRFFNVKLVLFSIISFVPLNLLWASWYCDLACNINLGKFSHCSKYFFCSFFFSSSPSYILSMYMCYVVVPCSLDIFFLSCSFPLLYSFKFFINIHIIDLRDSCLSHVQSTHSPSNSHCCYSDFIYRMFFLSFILFFVVVGIGGWTQRDCTFELHPGPFSFFKFWNMFYYFVQADLMILLPHHPK